MSRTDYAQGTFLQLEDGPFACGFVAGRALCPDGVVRAVRFYDGIADTFFSIPCRVSARGKTVSGYATVETLQGFSTPIEEDPAVVKFVPYKYRKNAYVFATTSDKEQTMRFAAAVYVDGALQVTPTVDTMPEAERLASGLSARTGLPYFAYPLNRQIRTGTQDPIAYTYEADHHCPACAAARFGVDEDGFIPAAATDSEGNGIGAVAPWDEWIEPSEDGVQVLACGTCGVELDRFEDVDAITAAADAAGYEAGTAAGGWVLDGNSSEETARALLRGIEDEDPMILDQLPSAPLSGEWADGLLPRDLLRDYGMTEDHDAADDVLTAYEDGYARGVVDEVTRVASAML